MLLHISRGYVLTKTQTQTIYMYSILPSTEASQTTLPTPPRRKLENILMNLLWMREAQKVNPLVKLDKSSLWRIHKMLDAFLCIGQTEDHVRSSLVIVSF